MCPSVLAGGKPSSASGGAKRLGALSSAELPNSLAQLACFTGVCCLIRTPRRASSTPWAYGRLPANCAATSTWSASWIFEETPQSLRRVRLLAALAGERTIAAAAPNGFFLQSVVEPEQARCAGPWPCCDQADGALGVAISGSGPSPLCPVLRIQRRPSGPGAQLAGATSRPRGFEKLVLAAAKQAWSPALGIATPPDDERFQRPSPATQKAWRSRRERARSKTDRARGR